MGDDLFERRVEAAARALCERTVRYNLERLFGEVDADALRAAVDAGWRQFSVDARVALEAADAFCKAEEAPQLSRAQIDLLVRIRDGRLGCADRADDKLRQQMRRAGYAKVVKNPMRWVLTDLGRAALAHPLKEPW